MIQELIVKNFAIAENISLKFSPNLNILTGETGAGKSIIINALMVVLGERTGTDVIRQGTDSATITGIFSIPEEKELISLLEKYDIEWEDELIIRRIISRTGKSRAYINDIPVNMHVLKEIGDFLVDIHGQHEHQLLLNQHYHLPYLDNFISNEELFQELKRTYQEVKKSGQDVIKLQNLQAELLQKKDYLEFQLKELKDANIKPGELQKLEIERNKLMHAEKIHAACQKITYLTEDSELNVMHMLKELKNEVKTLIPFNNQFESYLEELENLMIAIDEISRDAQEFSNSLEYSPVYQDEIENRISKIKKLISKYNKDESDLLELQQELENQLNTLENFDFELQQAREKYEKAKTIFIQLADKVSELRIKYAKVLAESVQSELKELGMPNARFQVKVHKKSPVEENFSEKGLDEVYFMFSSNPGEELKPLAKIASGGEISRLMLALKKVFADKDEISTLVFDEIDTGVSGETALAVGRKIHELSQSHQIICITHLPQIASQPGKHFVVQKEVHKQRTYTYIKELSSEERVHEVARLIGGKSPEKTVLDSARYLLEQQSS